MRNDQVESVALSVDLRQLPEFTPGAHLWPRIAAAQQRRMRLRRWGRGGIAAATAAVVCAAVLLTSYRIQPQQLVADGQRESQVLEGEWRRLAGASDPGSGGLTRLRFIDATLQAAYDRGAQADELAPLWRQRNQALRGLISHFQNPNARDATTLTRI